VVDALRGAGLEGAQLAHDELRDASAPRGQSWRVGLRFRGRQGGATQEVRRVGPPCCDSSAE
jgi:hypothetical protein